MKEYNKSKSFSSGMEYAIFLYNWCYNCAHYKEREPGFPEFPKRGGCPILDAMERARFYLYYFLQPT